MKFQNRVYPSKYRFWDICDILTVLWVSSMWYLNFFSLDLIYGFPLPSLEQTCFYSLKNNSFQIFVTEVTQYCVSTGSIQGSYLNDIVSSQWHSSTIKVHYIHSKFPHLCDVCLLSACKERATAVWSIWRMA